jgi:NADH:ubiquinone reductase (H+-translocating)
MADNDSRPHVVVVGGGFGGLNAVRALRNSPVDITLVDRTNHHLFQPLLYEVATGILPEGMIAPALRGILKRQQNVRTLLAEVTAIDVAASAVIACSPDGREQRLVYDQLIVAGGATHAYFGHSEWAEFAPGMKSLDDARRLRSRILGAFEMAEMADSEEERSAWLTFVVVGAGPTGVELTGQLAELAHRVLIRDYRRIDPRDAKIILIDAAPSVLGPLAPKLQQYTQRRLEKMHVEVRLETAAADMDEESITVSKLGAGGGEERIPARTKIWAAGVKASPLAYTLAAATGAKLDRAGRVAVADDCSLPGHPEIFAIGDMVSLHGLPGVAQPAIQEGKYVGHVIANRVAGRAKPQPFRYLDKGSMATIGRGRAVADAFGVKLTGLPAFSAWAFIHVLYLIGWGRRFGTLFSWAWSLLLTRSRGHRVITVEQAHDQLVHQRLHQPS